LFLSTKKLQIFLKIFFKGEENPSPLSFTILPSNEGRCSRVQSRDRRRAILNVLCQRRFETKRNLAFEFGVSTRTIVNDIYLLSLEYPIYTTSGNGGGIHIEESYKRNKDYLTNEEEALLRKIHKTLSGKEAETMMSIIKIFGKAMERRCQG
jgi:hypothetical protein